MYAWGGVWDQALPCPTAWATSSLGTPVSSSGAVPGAWPHQTQFLGKKLVWFWVTASSCIWICPQTATLDEPDETESGQAAMASSWRACGQCEGTNPSLHSPTVLDMRNATSFGVSRKRRDLSSGGPPSGLSVSLPYPVKASPGARGRLSQLPARVQP